MTSRPDTASRADARPTTPRPTSPPAWPAVDDGDPVMPVLIDRAAVAAMLGISPTTLDSWRSRGLVPPPCIVTTRIVRWSRTEIAAWIAARCPAADEWARRRESGRGSR